MDFKRINNILSGKTKSDDDKYERMCYILCKEFGWDYHTLMNQPIGFVQMMIKQHNKEMEKQNKKKGRR